METNKYNAPKIKTRIKVKKENFCNVNIFPKI